MPAVPLRTDFDAAMVRRVAATAKDPAHVRTLRDWAHTGQIQ